MKLLTKQKQVNFHGIKVWVPEWAKGIVAEDTGKVYAHELKPSNQLATYWHSRGRSFFITNVDLEGMDWRDTLVEVE